MDLSEFIAEIVPKEANIPALKEKAQANVEERVKSYYDQ
jgi:hypothetical protein